MIFISVSMKGTRDFLSVEAAGRHYLFLPPKNKTLMDARRRALREGRMQDLARLQQCERPPRFFHNDLHDLESLWWIAIWKILNYNPRSAASSRSIDARERAKQREHAKDLLFHQSNQALDRSLFLRTNVHYSDCLAWMQFDALKRALCDVRTAFVDKYSEFEAGFPGIQMQVFDGTHSLLRSLFRRCKECVREARLHTNRKPVPDSRRTRPEGTVCNTSISAPCGPLGRQDPIKACYHPLRGARCEICVPKPAKRMHDSIDDEPTIRPFQRARRIRL